MFRASASARAAAAAGCTDGGAGVRSLRRRAQAGCKPDGTAVRLGRGQVQPQESRAHHLARYSRISRL